MACCPYHACVLLFVRTSHPETKTPRVPAGCRAVTIPTSERVIGRDSTSGFFATRAFIASPPLAIKPASFCACINSPMRRSARMRISAALLPDSHSWHRPFLALRPEHPPPTFLLWRPFALNLPTRFRDLGGSRQEQFTSRATHYAGVCRVIDFGRCFYRARHRSLPLLQLVRSFSDRCHSE